MDDILHYHQILEIKPGASLEEIRSAYKSLVKVWHPDRFRNDPVLLQRAEQRLREINLAYEALVRYFTGGAESDFRTNQAARAAEAARRQAAESELLRQENLDRVESFRRQEIRMFWKRQLRESRRRREDGAREAAEAARRRFEEEIRTRGEAQRQEEEQQRREAERTRWEGRLREELRRKEQTQSSRDRGPNDREVETSAEGSGPTAADCQGIRNFWQQRLAQQSKPSQAPPSIPGQSQTSAPSSAATPSGQPKTPPSAPPPLARPQPSPPKKKKRWRFSLLFLFLAGTLAIGTIAAALFLGIRLGAAKRQNPATSFQSVSGQTSSPPLPNLSGQSGTAATSANSIGVKDANPNPDLPLAQVVAQSGRAEPVASGTEKLVIEVDASPPSHAGTSKDEAAESPPAWIPIYPRAKLATVETSSKPEFRTTSTGNTGSAPGWIRFPATDPPAKIMDFYTQAFRKDGFSVTLEVLSTQSPASSLLTAVRAGDNRSVRLVIKPEKTAWVVVIHYTHQ